MNHITIRIERARTYDSLQSSLLRLDLGTLDEEEQRNLFNQLEDMQYEIYNKIETKYLQLIEMPSKLPTAAV